MKTVRWLLSILIFCLYSGRVGSAELLGKFSDETATNQEKTAVDHKPKIIYRVICSAEGELSPECGQAPIADDIDDQAAQETVPEPSAPPETAAPQTETPPPTVLAKKPQGKTARSAPATKPLKHKKSAGKPAKQKQKPAQRKKRH